MKNAILILLALAQVLGAQSASKPPTALELSIGRATVQIDAQVDSLTEQLAELRRSQATLKSLLAAYYRESRATPVDPTAEPGDDQVPPGRFEAPPIVPTGKATILIVPGQAHYVDASRGGPRSAAGFELAEAIRMARPGDVIGVDGDFSGARPISIGGGIEGSKPTRAEWKTEPVRDLTIVGMNPGRVDELGSLELWQTYNGGGFSGGLESIRFENLTIRASRFARQPVLIPKGQTVGTVAIYACNLAGARDGNYAGFGQKWGIRSAGRATWDVRDTHCAGVQEHFAYLDSPQGDCYFVGLTMEKSWRTMLQIVNRPFDNPGPSSAGRILVEDCHARGIRGEGGGAFTLAGHLGEYYLRNCSVSDSGHGALVVYTETNPKFGVALFTGKDGRPYSTRLVEVDGLRVDLPSADRSHVAISGVESFTIRNFTIAGNQTALDLDTRFGSAPIAGPAWLDGSPADLTGTRILNGTVKIDVPAPIDAYGGWQAAEKVKVGGLAVAPSALR